MSIPDRLGDFRIVEEIGRGGFGVVYRAEQISLDRPVALKVLYQHRIHTKEEIARFEREAHAAARLDHPRNVSVYAWGEDDGNFFIAQKLVGRGRTLADELNELRAGGEPPKGYFRKVAERLALVADALQHAHERGIIHRDVKPSNVLLDDSGEPFLGDFGLAKVEDGLELSRTGDFAGSPYYMSPEQADARRGAIDHRTDIYSLGVALYELLTLKQPFQGRSSHELIRKILTEEPKTPGKVEPRVPRDLETICLKAMEKQRARRYQTAAQLASDLRAFLDGEPISALPVSTVSRVWRSARRHRSGIGVAGMAIALIAFAIWAQFSISEREERASELENRMHAVEAGGAIGEVKDEAIQEADQIINAQMDEAVAKNDLARVQELREERRQLVSFLEKGTDLVKQALPEVGDNETVAGIVKSMQSESLVDGVKFLYDYLQEQPENRQDSPRLTEFNDWLNRANEELGSYGSFLNQPEMGEDLLAEALVPVPDETPSTRESEGQAHTAQIGFPATFPDSPSRATAGVDAGAVADELPARMPPELRVRILRGRLLFPSNADAMPRRADVTAPAATGRALPSPGSTEPAGS